jgi:hypothetical protein
VDLLRFAIEPVSADVGRGFEVQIFVNDVEMTSAGAGLGMDPSDLLLPANRFWPADQPHRVPVARCDCGVYGCGSTDIMITAEKDVVHWDWLIEKPMNRRVTFDRDQYLSEVRRLETDRSWETPERVAVRLVAQSGALERLVHSGLRYGFSGDYYADPTFFQVSLVFDDAYQVFLHFPWAGRTPEQLVDEIERTLESNPRSWEAKWHGMAREVRAVAPRIAGPGWSLYRI